MEVSGQIHATGKNPDTQPVGGSWVPESILAVLEKRAFQKIQTTFQKIQTTF
jgi:hypothetical protein